jgi:hypothetical protein
MLMYASGRQHVPQVSLLAKDLEILAQCLDVIFLILDKIGELFMLVLPSRDLHLQRPPLFVFPVSVNTLGLAILLSSPL